MLPANPAPTVPSSTAPRAPASVPRSSTVSPATGLFIPAQAREYLHVTHDQLLDLVRTERLRAVRNPGGELCFAKADLDAIPVGVDAEVAAAELITTKDTYMFDATMAVPSEVQSPVTNRDSIADINRILDDLRRQMARSPKWVDIDGAVTLYGVPAKTLKEWSRNGFVRKSKLGPTFQAKSLYNTDDINDVLCKMAVGKPPANALRKEA
jgi:hypothetical protein